MMGSNIEHVIYSYADFRCLPSKCMAITADDFKHMHHKLESEFYSNTMDIMLAHLTSNSLHSVKVYMFWDLAWKFMSWSRWLSGVERNLGITFLDKRCRQSDDQWMIERNFFLYHLRWKVTSRQEMTFLVFPSVFRAKCLSMFIVHLHAWLLYLFGSFYLYFGRSNLIPILDSFICIRIGCMYANAALYLIKRSLYNYKQD